MNDKDKNSTVSSTSAFYRAMGPFRQGKTDLPRKLATEAAAKMNPLPVNEQNPLVAGTGPRAGVATYAPYQVDEQNPLAGGAGHDDLIMWLAYKEAKAMIPFDATPAAPGAVLRPFTYGCKCVSNLR